ncbi:RICIN domain-containing protein [Catenuloplanes sp. NPDC051500]|uniref:RICIN domain-containing protein n=1 Tax=Catenuloplanes sp. NPDC051500 TaxID=3363959 RepID=UPI0037A4EC00
MIAALAVLATAMMGAPAQASAARDAGQPVAQATVAAAAADIVHVQSGLCLDASASQGVRLNGCNGGAYQQWYSTTGWDVVHVRTGLCLDASVSQGAVLETCNGGTYQQWLW